jgi:hypothetical protein
VQSAAHEHEVEQSTAPHTSSALQSMVQAPGPQLTGPRAFSRNVMAQLWASQLTPSLQAPSLLQATVHESCPPEHSTEAQALASVQTMEQVSAKQVTGPPQACDPMHPMVHDAPAQLRAP